MADDARNWFDQGGDAYARYRPDYPEELASFLARVSPDRHMALDVGCGNGQFTCLLAAHFSRVVGLDPSADQIAHAVPHERVEYRVAPAEHLDVPDHSISLVTAAQAAHWFDLPSFYAEARRVAVRGAKIALISYGVAQLDVELNRRFLTFYHDEVGPYWPPERKLVDSGYADLTFPFPELHTPAHEIRRAWDAHDFLGYISTWSATRRAREAGQAQILEAFARDLLALWGDTSHRRTVVFPVHVRLGTIA